MFIIYQYHVACGAVNYTDCANFRVSVSVYST